MRERESARIRNGLIFSRMSRVESFERSLGVEGTMNGA